MPGLRRFFKANACTLSAVDVAYMSFKCCYNSAATLGWVRLSISIRKKGPTLLFLCFKNNNVGRLLFSIADYLCLLLF
ncbi:MAG: hypothetical protein ACI936_000802 [Paraglaciecola sp.]|jgi:hypothetical protein